MGDTNADGFGGWADEWTREGMEDKGKRSKNYLLNGFEKSRQISGTDEAFVTISWD